MSRVREAPATIKILLIAIVLILLPGAVLSYVSYVSVNERARRLEAGYRGTLYLVRDKVELEVLRLEQGLRSSLGDAAADLNSLRAARRVLSVAAQSRPWLRHPFLAGPDGQVVAPSMSFGWPAPSSQSLSWAPSLRDLLSRAEAAEFARKDPAGALEVYEQALRGTRPPAERAALLSRVGRCRFKLGEIQSGIRDYRELLELSDAVPTVGDIPTFIVALSQLTDGYAAAKDERARRRRLQLHRRLVESPWDLAPTVCEHYLKRTGQELEGYLAVPGRDASLVDARTMNALKQSEAERLEDMKRFDWIQRALLPEMRSGRNRAWSTRPSGTSRRSARAPSSLPATSRLRMRRRVRAHGCWAMNSTKTK
jgi:tetratricopeptide (TPR) repeat protein